MRRGDATVLHVDLDAFFASVEQLLEPELVGRPVIVGGTGPRGVVSAASYEARAFGVHSAMPMARARRLCPDAAFRSPRFDEYRRLSDEVMGVLGEVTPAVEQISVDEAFLDVAGARRLLGDGAAIGALLRGRVRERTGLTVSVGVATTKFLAKVASDLAKPDGLLVVPAGGESEFLAPLPVASLWGVGPATRERLERIGVRRVGDLAALPLDALVRTVGRAAGEHLHALARNDDPRPVAPGRDARSVGAEETFPVDLVGRADARREILRLADRVAYRLRAAGQRARTVTLKVRYENFETVTRRRTLVRATADGSELAGVARDLLDVLDPIEAPAGGAEPRPGRGIRLLGVSASQLVEEASCPETLDLGLERQRPEVGRRSRDELTGALDAVRARFGPRSVLPATLVERSGVETGREHNP